MEEGDPNYTERRKGLVPGLGSESRCGGRPRDQASGAAPTPTPTPPPARTRGKAHKGEV